MIQSLCRSLVWATSTDERLYRAQLTSLASLAARATSVVVGLITVPLSLSLLGPERYGIWLTLGSFLAWFSLVDLGMSTGLLNPLSEALAHHDVAWSRCLISSTFFLQLGMCLVVAVALIFIALFVPLERVFNTTTDIISMDLRGAVVLGLSFVTLSLPLRVTGVTFQAQQRGYFGACAMIVAQLLALVGLFSMLQTGASLTGFSLVLSGAPFVATACTFILLFYIQRPQLRPAFGFVTRLAVSTVGGQGLFFFLGTIGELVIFQTDYIVISQFVGLSEVPRYAVTYQVYSNLFYLVTVWLSSLWPAYAEAAAKKDWKWIKSAYRQTTVLSLGAMTVFGAGMIIFGQFVIGIWAGQQAVPSQTLLWVMAVYFVVWVWSWVNGTLLNSLGAVRLRVASTLANGVINLAATLLLVRPFGIVGVALGSLIGMILTDLWLFPFFLRTWIKKLTNNSTSA